MSEQKVARNTEGERAKAINDRIYRGLSHFADHAGEIVEDGGCYLVPSATTPGKFYRVRLDVTDTSGEIRDICPCIDYATRGRDLGLCFHTVSAMVFAAKGGALGHARRNAECWIEFRTGMRSHLYTPKSAYVLCVAAKTEKGTRYVQETVIGGSTTERRADRASWVRYESAVLVGTFASEDEMRGAYELLAGEAAA